MGFSAVAIADRVGHGSTEVTCRYAHLFPSKQTEMADKQDYITWRLLKLNRAIVVQSNPGSTRPLYVASSPPSWGSCGAWRLAAEYHICYENSRTHTERSISLTLEPFQA